MEALRGFEVIMRGIYLVLALLFCVTGTCWADQYRKFSELPNDLQNALKGHSQATLNLRFENGLSCTGVLVDPEGRALTNLHCIEGCLMEKMAYRKELAYEEPVFIDPKNAANKHFLQKIVPNLSKGLTCNVKIGINGSKDQTVSAEIIHIFGPGFLYPRPLVSDLSEKFPSVSRDLKNLGFEASGDLVLFKVPPQPHSSCVEMDFVSFESETAAKLVNLAYPTVLRKTNHPQSPMELIGDGETLLYSAGEASASINYLRKIFGANSAEQISAILPHGTFLSSTDAEVGTSGSPLFSKEGRLIGVTRATYNFNQTEYSAWLTQGISLEVHKQKLEELLSLNSFCL